jgi:hypothetical protein
MAIKGLTDLSVYVIDGFTALNYTKPAISQGDFVTSNFVAFDYVLEDLELTSSFTLQAEGTVSIVAVELNSAFTLSAEGLRVDFGAASLQSQFAITEQTGAIKSSGVLNLQAFYTQVQLAGYLLELEPEDYTWQTFAEDAIIDRSWDDWFADRWDSSAILFTINTVSRAVGGFLAQGSGSMNSAFAEEATYTRLRDQNTAQIYGSVATLLGLGNATLTGSGSHNAIFSTASDYIRYRDQSTPISHNALFTSTQNANAKFGPSKELTSSFASTQNGNATFRPSREITAIFGLLGNLNFLMAQLRPAEMQAFAFEISEGRLISLPDPYFTIKALQEFRTYIVPEESRIIECLGETRVNTAPTENRGIEVLQETRNYRIFTPAFKNRSSIPRVRGDY